jgi:TonB family protein
METAPSVRYRSMTISVLVHLALFLALYFLVMEIKIPPFGEAGGGGGVLVNIGYVDLASGDVQPLSENITTEPQPVKEKITASHSNEKIATQEFEESTPVVTSKKTETKKTETKKTTTVTETKPVVKEKTVDQKAMYKGKTNSTTSQGTSTTGTGDQGNPAGDPNSKYYGNNGGGGTGTGPGTGSGIGSGHGDGIGDFNLKGRSIMRRPSVVDNSQETGKVVVEIVVDKNGNVTSTSIERGTTTSNAHLQQLALKAARETKFSPSITGQEIQSGTITFVFVVH